ncbi:WecB/TagA/CpsF family glycosyltransferase [Arenicella xantha]|nr:WecB/TagA/CpsF family glycosyltransferase [Arenicella xantha]
MRFLIAFPMLAYAFMHIGVSCLIALVRRQRISLYSEQYLGEGCVWVVHQTVLIENRPLADFDRWLHYLRANYDLVGPRRVRVSESSKYKGGERVRFTVAPGVLCPYAIKQSAGIAYSSESAVVAEFIQNDSLLRRGQLLLVWLVQRCLGSTTRRVSKADTFQLFGVRISNTSMADAVAEVGASIDEGDGSEQPACFAFVNAECVNQYCDDQSYREVLNDFSSVFADGIGVRLAAMASGVRIIENVNGTDMFPLLCDRLSLSGARIYLLGGSTAVVSKVADKLACEYPGAEVVGYLDGYSLHGNDTDVCDRINASNADVVLVALGAPMQEKWMAEHRGNLSVSAMIGVGGLFDFYSGEVARAPEWIRELSLEWVWRLAMQPKAKARRYLLGTPLFLVRVLRDKLIKSTATSRVVHRREVSQ